MAKDGAALLIGLGRPKGAPAGGSVSEEEEDMGEGAEEEALSDFFSMGKAGDLAGAKEALKTFMGLCYPELGGGEEYEEGDASEEV